MAGSRKGIPNRPKRAIQRLLKEQFPNYNPIIEMVKVAINEENDMSMRFNANREVAKYIEPQLKAVQMSGDEDNPVTVEHIVREIVDAAKN